MDPWTAQAAVMAGIAIVALILIAIARSKND